MNQALPRDDQPSSDKLHPSSAQLSRRKWWGFAIPALATLLATFSCVGSALKSVEEPKTRLVVELDLTHQELDTTAAMLRQAQHIIHNRAEVLRNSTRSPGLINLILGFLAPVKTSRQGAARVVVEIPGCDDVERAKRVITQPGQVEFQLVEPDEDRNRLVQHISTVLAARGQDSPKKTEGGAATDTTHSETEAPSLFDTESEQNVTLFGETEETSQSATLESMLTLFGNNMLIEQRSLPAVRAMLTDPMASGAMPDDVEFLFSKAYEVIGGRMVRASETSSGSLYYFMYLVREKPEMTGNMVESAFVSIGQSVEYLGQPIVSFETTDEGVRVFRQVTGGHIGERLGIVLDGAVYSVPTIQSQINSGRSIITGCGTEEEAKDLVTILEYGALPMKVTVLAAQVEGEHGS